MLNGNTTQFDVKKLMESFKTEEGDTIEHLLLEEVIGVDRNNRRYKSVLTAWKKTLFKDRNVILEAIRGVGFVVLNNTGKMKASAGDVTKGTRSFARATKKLASVRAEELNEHQRRSYDHQARFTAALLVEATKTRKTIAIQLGEYEALPRRQEKKAAE